MANFYKRICLQVTSSKVAQSGYTVPYLLTHLFVSFNLLFYIHSLSLELCPFSLAVFLAFISPFFLFHLSQSLSLSLFLKESTLTFFISYLLSPLSLSLSLSFFHSKPHQFSPLSISISHSLSSLSFSSIPITSLSLTHTDTNIFYSLYYLFSYKSRVTISYLSESCLLHTALNLLSVSLFSFKHMISLIFPL